MMPDTASPAASIVVKAASSVRRPPADGRAQRDLGGDRRACPPSRRTRRAGRARRGSSALPPSVTSAPSGSTTRAQHVVREAVLQAVRPARVLGDVAADRADLLARRIRGVEEALRRPPARVTSRFITPGSTTTRCAVEIDLEDPVHARQRDDDPLGDGQRAARRPVPAPRATNGTPSRAQSRTTACTSSAEPGRATSCRPRAPAGEPVAVVRRKLLRLGQDERVAERRAEVVDEAGSECHAADPTRGPMP